MVKQTTNFLVANSYFCTECKAKSEYGEPLEHFAWCSLSTPYLLPELAKQQTAELIEDLKSLVQHCWIYQGYENCGYSHMPFKLRTLYNSIIDNENDE